MTKKIFGLIPAGGKGSRLAPFPCPKELFPIGYQDYEVNGKIQRRPKVVSQYLIENILQAGAQRLAIIVSEGKGDIMKYYGDGHRFGTTITYLYQEEPKGMPEALILADGWIDEADTIIFGMPDTIIEPRDAFQQLLGFHQKEDADLTLGLFHTDLPQKFGMVAIDEHNNVVYTVDKPQDTDLQLMWGCACWNTTFNDLIKEHIRANQHNAKENVLGDVFNEALKRKLRVKGLEIKNGKYIDIGTSDELDAALKKFHL